MTDSLLETNLPGIELLARGKVRDTYIVGADQLLVVATDRISAFDRVMKTGIPGKGRVLTQMTEFWLRLLANITPNHLITTDTCQMPEQLLPFNDSLHGRSMLVRRLKMLPVEAIVRGYITGSGWKEYRNLGTVCGIQLPTGLKECDQLPTPLYTPSTKADVGHDQNIHPDQAAEILGRDVANQVAQLSVELYRQAAAYALTRGIIIADTKFEFGLDEDGQVVLADEVLTPDSSRFWPASQYEPGHGQPSYDKQYLRDWLEQVDFNKDGDGIALPEEVALETARKYEQAFQLLTQG